MTRRPLTEVANRTGRLDVLVARLIDEATRRHRNPIVREAYLKLQPAVERALTSKIGPRTKRGKQIVENLFALREVLAQSQQRRVSQ